MAVEGLIVQTLSLNLRAYRKAARDQTVFWTQQTRPGLLALILLLLLLPLIFLAACYPWLFGLLAVAVLVILLSLLGQRARRRPRILYLTVLILIYCSFNFSREALSYWRQKEWSESLKTINSVFEGECQLMRCLSKDRAEGKGVFLVRVRSVQDRSLKSLRGCRLIAYAPLSLQNTMTFRASGPLSALKGARNLGAFSERAYGRGLGAALSLSIRSESFRPLGMRFGHLIRQAMDRFALDLSEGVKEELKPRQAALFSALFLGDKAGMTARDKEVLLLSSLSHLTSVSGYHLYFLLLPLAVFFRQKPQLRRYELLLSLLILLPWLLMIGLRASLFRAFLLFLIQRVANLLGARSDGLNTMSWLIVISLIYDPFLAFNLGFLLSLTASAAILILAPPIRRRLLARWPWLGRNVISQISVSLAVQICLFVPQFWLFSHLHLLSIPINIVASVLVSMLFQLCLLYFLLKALLALKILGGLGTILGGLLFGSMRIVIDAFYHWAKLASQVPTQVLGRDKLPLILVLFFAILTLQAWRGRPLLRAKIWRRAVLAIFLSASLFCIFFAIYNAVDARRFAIHYLDVGQGNSTFIRYKGRTLLVDGGVPEQAGRTLWPFLRYLGVRQIDLAVITHGHNDHIGGILELCQSQMIRQIAYPLSEIDEPNSPYNAAFWADFKQRFPAGSLTAGQTIELFNSESDGPLIEVMAPALDRRFVESNKNDASVVLRFEHRGIIFWLTGDATAPVEAEIVAREKEKLSIASKSHRALTCLLVAHHGSTSSSTEEFLAAYPPDLAIISVGQNRYGHPRAEVLGRLGRTARVLQTQDLGAISLKASHRGWQIHYMLPNESYLLTIP